MNILIVTPIYPRNDVIKKTTATKVVHYFAKEWQRQGHKILVVTTPTKLFPLIYIIPQKLKDIIKAKTGSEISDINIIKKCSYEYEGISVIRRPVFRLVPRTLPSKSEISKCCKEIYIELQKKSFVPDLILGHWECPEMQILSKLNDYFKCKKSIVIHGMQYINKYHKQLSQMARKIDAIGVRSKTMTEYVKDKLSLNNAPFVCYSGLPDDYIIKTTRSIEKFKEPIRKYIYVGELIARKNCDSVIRVLSQLEDSNWTLDVVGIGNEEDALKKLADSLKVGNRIHFHGRVSRDEVLSLMKTAQCFVMTSREETFGLVYLEAMLASCIVIGSKKEGIDGIVNDELNGYLVTPGDDEELEKKIKMIINSPIELNQKVASKGYETAIAFSDSIVSKKYLEDVNSWTH